jgi:hypothetical protein
MIRRLMITSVLLLSCGDGTETDLPERPDDGILVYVCHNPDSIWHLSECNDGGEACTSRDYDGDAYCLALRERMCQVPHDMQSNFLRMACGFYSQ